MKQLNWLKLQLNFWRNAIKIQLDKKLTKTHFIGHNIEMNNKSFKSRLLIKPLDAREYVKPILEECFSSLHVSGTLISEVYENLTGLKEITKPLKIKQMEYPFSRENVRTMFVS